MRTLVIVHLEPAFNLTGDLEIMASAVVRFSNLFDKTININSYSVNGPEEFDVIGRQNYHTEEWIWGMDPQDDEEGTWRLGDNYIHTTGHCYSEILDWMKKLPKDHKYTLVGGARWECLLDIYEIFIHLGLDVNIHESLTYGS